MLKQQLLAITADRSTPVEIPGAGTVHVHAMSETERAQFELMAGRQKNQTAVKRMLIVMTARESANRETPFIFSAADIEAMGQMDSAVINKLAETAMTVCGIGDVDLESLLKKPASDSKPTTVG